MGKNSGDRHLRELKENNYMNEAIKKCEMARASIQTESEVVIYAKIEPIGKPQIYCTLTAPLKKTILTPQKKHDTANKDKAQTAMDKYEAVCISEGVVPVAQIGPLGAQISYMLTQEKKQALSGIVPNQPAGSLGRKGGE